MGIAYATVLDHSHGVRAKYVRYISHMSKLYRHLVSGLMSTNENAATKILQEGFQSGIEVFPEVKTHFKNLS